jgi:hypothetical protein
MAGVISDNIFGKCSVAASTDLDRCGAVTLCNISPTTDDELASIYKDGSSRWRIIGALLEADFTGKACQAEQYGMFDWIMANKRELGTKKIAFNSINSGLAEVMPFIKMLRKHPINNEYWNVASGNGAGGTVDGQSYDWTGIVTSQTGIPADARWFPPRIRVFINAKSAGGTATRTAWKVVTATEIGSNQIRLYLKDENTASSLDPSKLSDPVTGYLTRGTPNVNDYENYCAQIPGLNTNQLTPYWWESVRWTTCDDELYQKYVSAIRDNNPLFKMFGDVESVELNRQIMADFQRRHAWSFFFNKPLPHQTLTDYDNLEQITVQSDDAAGNYLYLPFEGRCIGRRANATGIYEQHAECGMVKDLQGQILNLQELFNGLYKIMRVRKANGIAQGMSEGRPVIEIFTDSFYAVQFAQGMLRYFKDKSEGLLRLNMDISSKVNAGPMGFFYTRFALDYPNVELRVVTHPFFDDLVDAAKKASASLESTGRVLWVFDWTSNYQAILGSNSVTNRSGDAQRLAEVSNNFMCTMKVPRKSQKMNSMAYSNIAECPQASLLLENFSSDVPEHAGISGSGVDYYGDYVG